MTIIKETHSIKLVQVESYLFEIRIRGELEVSCNTLECGLSLYQLAYDREYCVDMY